MILSIIRFSLKNKPFILFGVLALIAAGVYSFNRLPIDAIPDITNNQVQILTVCPTLSTQEVEQFVTMPIEQEVRFTPGILELRSISRFGLSVITLVFEEDIPIFQVRQMVNERLQKVIDEIPSEYGQPELAPVSTGLGEILHYRIEPKPGYEHQYSAMDLRTLQDKFIKRQLAGIEGVVEVNSFGGYLKQYEIAADPDRLRQMNISLTELFKAVEDANQNTGGAYIEKGPDLYFIRTEGLAKTLEDIRQIVVDSRDGQPILVGDLAEVKIGEAIRYGAVSSQGSGEIVLGIVMMMKDANASAVIKRVKERMEIIKPGLPEGVQIISFLDRESLVNRTIATVRNNLLEGALIVILILFLFVGDWRAALIIGSVIPLSMLFTLIMMNLTGVSANLMSLGALDFGLVIDAAIILVEATLFYLLLRQKNEHKEGILSRAEMDATIEKAGAQVARSSVFGVLIILLVYLPIMSLSGIEGKMFRPMAFTVAFALIGALILSLTYIPVASSLFLSRKWKPENRITHVFMRGLHHLYTPVFNLSMRHPYRTVGLSVLAFVGSIFLFNRMGGEFIPELDEGDLMIHGFCKPGTSLTQTMESHRLMQQVLVDEFPDEIDQVISKIGTAEIPTDPMAIETADNIVLLHPIDQWKRAESKSELIGLIELSLEKIPGMAFEFTQPIKMRFDEMMTGVRSDIAIKLYGEDLDTLTYYGEQIALIAGNVNGTKDIKVEQITGLPQLNIRYQYDQMARYGISVAEANQSVSVAFAGGSAGRIYENEKQFDLVVRLSEANRKNLETMRSLPVRSSQGALIPLEQIARIEFIEGAAQISREEGQRRIVVSSNVREKDVETVMEEVTQLLDQQLTLPEGYYLRFGGQFENLVDAKRRLKIAVPVALALIALLLFIAFRSWLETILILTAIPLSAIGGVLALWVRDMPFSISAGIGFIALFGIAVLNGIVLVTYLRELEMEGKISLYARIEKATHQRLRPVLMTATTDAFGFLPMAIAVSAGAEVQRPLATVVIGGIITATFLTLVVLPALYSIAKKRQYAQAKNILIPVFLLFAATSGFSQLPPALSEAEALSLLKLNHPEIRAWQFQEEAERIKAKHPVPWQPAEVYHGINADPGEGFLGTAVLGVEQFFPARSQVKAGRSLYDARARTAVLNRELSSGVLEQEVRLLYLSLSLNRANFNLLHIRDSLYQEILRVAEIREKVGETMKMETQLAMMKAREVQRKKQESVEAYFNLCQQLSLQLQSEEVVNPLVDPLVEIVIIDPVESIDLKGTILIQKQQSTAMEMASQLRLMQSLSKPEFGVNLMGQYTADGRIYPGYFLTLRLPLMQQGFQSNIQAASYGVLKTESDASAARIEIEKNLSTIQFELKKLTDQINWYRSYAIPAADELLRVTMESYRQGGIRFSEWVLAVDEYQNVNQQYYLSLHDYKSKLLTYQLLTR
jgi:heavy metal efflux system protein